MKFYLITLLTLLGTMANAKADCTYNYVPESFGGWSSVESNYFSRKNINFVSLIQIELAKKNWSFADKSQNSFYLGLTKIRNTRNVFNVFVHGGNDVNLIEINPAIAGSNNILLASSFGHRYRTSSINIDGGASEERASGLKKALLRALDEIPTCIND